MARPVRGAAVLCRQTIDEVGTFVRNRLKSMQRRSQLVTAFGTQTELEF